MIKYVARLEFTFPLQLNVKRHPMNLLKKCLRSLFAYPNGQWTSQEFDRLILSVIFCLNLPFQIRFRDTTLIVELGNSYHHMDFQFYFQQLFGSRQRDCCILSVGMRTIFLLKRATFTTMCLKEENLGSILVVCLIIVPTP